MTPRRLFTFALQAASWLEGQAPLGKQEATKHFDWDSTPAHKHFVWHHCFDDFKCARLQVPMDWHGTSDEANQTVEIAVIKVEATVSVTDPSYGGAVVVNPGGSGVVHVLRGGHFERDIVSSGPNSTDPKYFDIISFDPRGVNNTRPRLSCFPNYLDEAAYELREETYGMIDSSETAFDHVWTSQRAVADGCSRKAASDGIGKHMSTAPVVRDIIEIFERHGEWRAAEAQRLLRAQRFTRKQRNEILERTAYKPGGEMVQYWGFSYGTILGATLSAMYPERIKRAVLDGVADAHDYMAGGWLTNLRDTDLTFVKLADYCYQGGAENCALYDKDGPAVIVENIQAIFKGLKEDSIPVPGNSTHGPQVVTYNDLQTLIRDIVYKPLVQFPMTAQILHEVSQGEATTLADWVRARRPDLSAGLSEKCLKEGPYSPACFPPEDQWRATSGIACSDAAPRLNETKDEYREYAKKVIAQSRLIGASWATIQMPCTAWHARPHWRYEGDFHNKTAHPLLFAGNTIDPVTPLHNAFTMAEGFEGAGVLQQNSEGHCTAASVSMCSGRSIREYFQSGSLPGSKGQLGGWNEYGALCEQDRQPFDGYSKGTIPGLPKGERDEGLWRALVGLNQA